MRDRNDNVVVICSIENLDPMGVHTGDSVTVAPALTLTDREYQRMRDLAIDVIRAVGVDTGGCNIQFAVEPDDRPHRRHRDEPARVALVGAGVQGDRLPDRQDRRPAGHRLHARRDPERHHPRDAGVVRAVARLRRGEDPALRVREVPRRRPRADDDDEERRRGDGDGPLVRRGAAEGDALARADARRLLGRARPAGHGRGLPRAGAGAPRRTAARRRAGAARSARRPSRCTTPPASTRGSSTSCCRSSSCGPSSAAPAATLDEALLRRREADGLQRPADRRRPRRSARRRCGPAAGELGVRPVYKTVDTCAAEFAAETPYHYSSYDEETEVAPSSRRKVLILGSGPNRIGQGIEFDYACVHASFALAEAGFETVMVNCNPETVSTDYDTSDRLYFEPLTVEDVLEVVAAEQESARQGGGELVGVLVQLGGQTPLRLAQELKDAGRPDRRHQPRGDPPRRGPRRVRRGARRRRAAGAALRPRDVVRRGEGASPRPWATRCWCGRRTCSAGAAWRSSTATRCSSTTCERSTLIGPDHPVLVDRFLEDAVEIDVDALFDGEQLYLAGVMEHIEEAGIHSGDSACALPPITLGRADLDADPHEHPRHRRGRRRARAAQRAVRAEGRRALRPRGQPAGQPHGAVRVQGDGRAGGQGRRADHARRDGRRAARRGAAAGAPATAATCRTTRRSR